MSWVQPPPALAGYWPPECRCGHLITVHGCYSRYCAVTGCGCSEYVYRGDGPVVPVPDNTNPDRPF